MAAPPASLPLQKEFAELGSSISKLAQVRSDVIAVRGAHLCM